MGIPRLATYLSPYAVPTILGCERPDCTRHPPHLEYRSNRLIIDGPSFTYEVHHRLLANKPSFLDALGKIPSYHEVGKTAIWLLNELERCGLIIDKVYFDGFLPPHKRETRLSRMNHLVGRLSSSRAIHNHGFQNTHPSKLDRSIDPSILFNAAHPHSKSQGLPEAPFLVPAVIEALKNSKYATIISVVPGEADAYCAEAARRNGGTILTNDSDLLIYDLGPDGAVGSLHQLAVTTTENNSSSDLGKHHRVVKTTITKPQAIAHKLSLANLQTLAYMLKTEQCSFQEAVKHAKQTHLTPSQIASHLDEYTTHPSDSESKYCHPTTLSHFLTHPHLLDPRLAEFILSLHTQDPLPTIYLPLPLSNPLHTSSFAPSLPIRNLTYSIFTLLSPTQPPKKIHEYTPSPTPVPLLPHPFLNTHARTLHSRLQTHKATFSDLKLPSMLLWRVYALKEVYLWHLDTSRSPPQRDIVLAALTGHVVGAIGWDYLHLGAQVEGWLYSLRMLRQGLGFVMPLIANNEPMGAGIELMGALNDLLAELRDLPPLADLMPSRGELAVLTAEADVDAEDVLNRLAGMIWDEMEGDGEGEEEGGRDKGSGDDCKGMNGTEVAGGEGNAREGVNSAVVVKRRKKRRKKSKN